MRHAAKHVLCKAQDCYRKALDAFTEDEPMFLVVEFLAAFENVVAINWIMHQDEPGWQERDWPYERLKWALETYDVAVHHLPAVSHINLDCFLAFGADTACLLRSGDLRLTELFLNKVEQSIAPWLVQATEDFPGEIFTRGMMTINYTRPLFRSAGFAAQGRAIAKAMQFTYETADTVGAAYAQITAAVYGYTVGNYTYFQAEGSQMTFKRLGYLMDPDSVDVAELKQALWPAEWGSFNFEGKQDAVGILGFGCTGFEAGEVFEQLGDIESAMVAAEADLASWPFALMNLLDNRSLLGRCCARLGRMDEARAHFESVILLARSTGAFFYEMLAHRNYIVHVLDAEGKRDSQLAELGGAITKLVLDPAEYTPLLGASLDADVAVAAFRARAQET